MRIHSIDLNNKRLVNAFIEFPFRLYKETPQWVPPLLRDERLRMDRRRYHFYRHSEAAFFIAERMGRVVGRLAVADNRRYNEYKRERTAFFHLFECENDMEAARGLFEAGFEWARARGLDRMIGPKGFTPMEGFGLLVKGFEHRPAFGQPYNPPYYSTILENLGFRRLRDVVSGYLGEGLRFPQRIHELADRVCKRRGLRIARYRTRKDLRALVPHLQRLYNETLASSEGNVPISEEEANALANQLLWFADPNLVKVVMKGDQPVGFLLAYPDISAALQRTRGRLFPFGWLTLLREIKRTEWLNINGAGLIPEYRGLGGTAILFSEIYKSATESGQFRHAELVQIDTQNANMQREMENFGVDFYKMHRLYERPL